MKVTLKNFRCHEKKTWIFPDKGLCLLEGMRGEGKSTVLNGILYGLYGPSALRRPCTFGKSSATVEIEFGPLKITRTSKPRKLNVWSNESNSEYEGDAAQSVIENWIGLSLEEFKYSCYIPQKSNGSILSLSPQDQLYCVEKISLKDENHINICEKIKTLTKNEENTIRKLENNLEISKRLLEEFKDQRSECSQCSCPIELEENESYTSETRIGLETMKNNLDAEIEKQEVEYEELEKELQDKREIDEEIVCLRTTKQTIQSTLDRIEHELDGLILLSPEEVSEKERRLSEIDKELNYIVIRDKLRDRNNQLLLFTKEKKKELNKLQKSNQKERNKLRNLEELEEEIASSTTEKLPYSKEEAIANVKKLVPQIRKELGVERSIKSTKAIVSWLENHRDELENEVEVLKDNLENANQALGQEKLTSQVWDCPSCKTKLTFKNGVLIKNSSNKKSTSAQETVDNIHSSIQQKEETCKLCDDYSSQLQLYLQCVTTKKKYISESELDLLKEEQRKVLIFDKELKRIKDESDNLENSSTTIRLRKEITDLEQKLNDSSHKCEKEKDELEKEKVELTETLTIYFQEMSRVGTLQIELQSKRKELSAIERKLRACGERPALKALDKNLSNIRKALDIKRYHSRELSEDICLCKEYETFLTVNEKIEKTAAESVIIQKNLKISKIRYQDLLKLKELSFQAQVVAVQQVIEDINAQSKYYLDLMFQEEPIEVRLESVKETKKNAKLQMNVIVDYRSHKYDGVDQLSGGERDQANLAFVMGLNSMLGGKILMLDECLASLDSETNSQTLEMLKTELGNDKLILVVSHEAIRGNFDFEVKA